MKLLRKLALGFSIVFLSIFLLATIQAYIVREVSSPETLGEAMKAAFFPAAKTKPITVREVFKLFAGHPHARDLLMEFFNVHTDEELRRIALYEADRYLSLDEVDRLFRIITRLIVKEEYPSSIFEKLNRVSNVAFYLSLVGTCSLAIPTLILPKGRRSKLRSVGFPLFISGIIAIVIACYITLHENKLVEVLASSQEERLAFPVFLNKIISMETTLGFYLFFASLIIILLSFVVKGSKSNEKLKMRPEP